MLFYSHVCLCRRKYVRRAMNFPSKWMICFKMKLTKLQFYFHTFHIFTMWHTNVKNKKYIAQSLGCQLATWQKNRLSKVAGSPIQQMNKLYSASCILALFRSEGNLLWPHMHFSSTLHSTQDIHQSVTTPHTCNILHSHHPLPIQGFIMHSYKSFQNLTLHWNRRQPPQRPKYSLVLYLRRALVHIQSHSLKIQPKINRTWKMNLQAYQISIFNFKY